MSASASGRFPRAVLPRLARAAVAAAGVGLALTVTPPVTSATAVVDIAAKAPTSLSAGSVRSSAVRIGEAPPARSQEALPGSMVGVQRSVVVVLAQAASLDQVLTNIRNLILGVAGGAALVCWSVAGLRMMFSQGDPGEVAKARAAFRAGAVGFAVVILAPLALAILRTVVGL
jgi:Type IV secretion system pilin